MADSLLALVLILHRSCCRILRGKINKRRHIFKLKTKSRTFSASAVAGGARGAEPM
ncbi:MAG: hypothetical protein JJT95_07785 [Pararhodobacter sp.]|nr:hypothetical protein [Pararhodobacter sp.]